MMASSPIFAPRTVFWLLTVGTLSFVGAVALSLLAEEGGSVQTSGANSFSYSGIGHRALVEVLERVHMPVLVSRHNSVGKAGTSSLLVVAEPRAPTATPTALKRLFDAWNVLLVLPKWDGESDGSKPGWIETARLLPVKDVEQMLKVALGEASVIRPSADLSWKSGSFPTPTLTTPQLVQSPQLEPVIASDQGVLLGRLDNGWTTVWVLSDPDVLSNHGIGQGENGILSVRMMDHMRPELSTIVIDETIHGFEAEPRLSRAVVETPLAITAAIAVMTLAMLMWAATGRFGAPLPAARPIKPGKAGLIDNTAGLLEYGGHGIAILNRYLRVALRDAASKLHAPPQLRGAELVAWFDRVGKSRGVKLTCAQICDAVAAVATNQRVDGARLARVAQSVNRWKQEMLHGPGGHSKGQDRSEGTDR